MVSINPIIAELKAKDLKRWIAGMKKTRPDVDWESEVKKLRDELNPVIEESK